MIVGGRRYANPRLDAMLESIDVRIPGLRVSVCRSRNVATDFALLEKAAPFLHALRRPQLTVLFRGEGRYEEGGRRQWLERPGFVVSDPRSRGTEAYAGTVRYLVLTWEPARFGVPVTAPLVVEPMTERESARMESVADRIAGPRPAEAIAELVSMLRTLGFRFATVNARDLEEDDVDPDLVRLEHAMASVLSRLEEQPSIEDLVSALGWNQRRVHRRLRDIVERYGQSWAHWRDALHQERLLRASQLLAAPGATTELVARATGFRAPTALCHAFAKAGWPSPGVLAQAARRNVLDAWTAFVPMQETLAIPTMRKSA